MKLFFGEQDEYVYAKVKQKALLFLLTKSLRVYFVSVVLVLENKMNPYTYIRTHAKEKQTALLFFTYYLIVHLNLYISKLVLNPTPLHLRPY